MKFNKTLKTTTLLTLAILFSSLRLPAQQLPTSPDQLSQAIRHRQQMRAASIFKNYPVRNVGPIVMGGRVTDLAVNEDHPSTFYVAYASGGVFKTTNRGNTMKPIFDNQGSLTIGDIALSRADNDVIWVGTGEKNSSRSSYAGAGVYRSTDGGQSWEFAGLRGSQHIARIVTHPTNPDIAWAASMGALYTHNSERGVYKTTDGGKTWKKTLFVNDSTGVIDLVIHPNNPQILWASTWERERKAWNFKEDGVGSAIWKSTDGGETWHKSVKGFPQGKYVGRIGLDVSRSNPDILYAVLDNQKETRKEKEKEQDELTAADFVDMKVKTFLELEDKKIDDFLRHNGFPKKYNAERVKQEIQDGQYKPKALAEYLGDANEALFDTNVKGLEVYRSDDGGDSWKLMNTYEFDNVYFTYGYYFGEVRVNPQNPDQIYVFGVPFLRSDDAGKSWKELALNQDVHVDHHAMWIDPQHPDHLLLGNDGGVYESYDQGLNFISHNTVAVGQFYSVAVDMEEPYNIYGGLQDNGVFYGSSQNDPENGPSWKRLLGGDGMHVAVNPKNPDWVYTGFQFGHYYRIERSRDQTTPIQPKPDIGQPRYRFNWNTPVNMSHHNPDILYMGSQKIHRTMDRGDNWEELSDDLTEDLHGDGNVPYSTITTIAESPLEFNVIWAGTDDGNIYVSRDAGTNWQLVSESLPNRWISEIHASNHDPAKAYVTLTGYRRDEFRIYVYKTTDYGQTWTSIKGNLPEEPANVVEEDPKVPGLLYLGTDGGTYMSFNDGKKWQLINGLPNVPAYDMLVHPRDNELVVGTHGRSVYVIDVKPLQQLAGKTDTPLMAFSADPVGYSERWGQRSARFRDINEPEVQWLYYLGSGNRNNSREVTITVKNDKDETVYDWTEQGKYGFNRASWNLQIAEKQSDEGKTVREYLKQGTYTIEFKTGKVSDHVEFEIK